MNKIKLFFWILTAAVMGLAVASGCQKLEISGGSLDRPDREILSRIWSAQVVGVTDGDTIKVRLQSQGDQVRVRLYGIDAPEKGQSFGRKSREFLASLAVIGEAITVEPVNFDRYGRLVAVLYGPDGQCLNEAMVAAGLAWVYPQYCRQPACDSWWEAESQARQNRAGLWAESDPTPPWEWRK